MQAYMSTSGKFCGTNRESMTYLWLQSGSHLWVAPHLPLSSPPQNLESSTIHALGAMHNRVHTHLMFIP